jgi:hypothetical protein
MLCVDMDEGSVALFEVVTAGAFGRRWNREKYACLASACQPTTRQFFAVDISTPWLRDWPISRHSGLHVDTIWNFV